MLRRILRKNFYNLFIILKKIKFFFFKNDINNSHFYLVDLKIISRELNINNNDKELIIIDVGSHIGNEALQLALYYPKAKIYCFEPVEEVFQKLKINVFKKNNIECHNLFIRSDDDQNIEMFIDCESDLVNSRYPETDLTKTTKKKITVKSNTLDNFCKNKEIKNIFLLRVDVNGYEKNVLKSAENLILQKKIDFIHVYFFNIVTKLEGGSLYEISTYLSKNNYRLISFYNTFFHKKFDGGYYSATFARSNLQPLA